MRPLPQDVIATDSSSGEFRLTRPAPAREIPLILTSPHSGTGYTADLLAQSRLPLARLRASEDSLVDELIAPAPALGATTLSAGIPRVFCDLNRAPWELDPAMFVESLPGHCDTGSFRIAQGYGTIARFAAAGDAVYAHRLSFTEAQRRIAQFWQPWHDALAAEIDRLHARFGICVLIDCHSMPTIRAGEPDLVFGDGFGTSCAPDWPRLAEAVAWSSGFRSVRNDPYAGGYITRHYGRPDRNIHALQIEIARPLYLQRKTHRPGAGFTRVQEMLTSLTDAFITELPAPRHT